MLLESAASAVTHVALNMKDAPGHEKREAAFDMIRHDISTKGYSISTSIINMAIETAVQNLKLTNK
jgi:hypothetical protein